MTRFSGTARLDERGRLLLPADLRRSIGLGPGDDVHMTLEDDGALRVVSRRAAAFALIGLAGPSPHSAIELVRRERVLQGDAEAALARRVSPESVH